MYTAQQIEEAVNRDWALEEPPTRPKTLPSGRVVTVYPPESWSDMEYSNFLVIGREIVDCEVVETTGGMDRGSNASVTIKIGDQYFRKEGAYASHYGYDWDGPLLEVVPVKKVVTVYEPKK